MEALSDLWKAENIFYPPAICETASVSFEATSDPHEAGVTQSEVTQIIVPPDESTERGEPHDATEAPGGLNPEMPQEVAPPTVSAPIYCAEKPAILVQPLQAIPLTDVSQGTEADPAKPSQEGDVPQGSEANPANPAQPSQDVAQMKLKK